MGFARAAVMMALLIGCASAQAQLLDDEAAKRHYFSGQAYFNRARYQDALHEFTEAFRLSGRAAVLFNIGECQARLDQPAEAIDSLERYLREEPQSPRRVSVAELVGSLRAQLEQQRARALAPPVAPSPPVAPAPLATVAEPLGPSRVRAAAIALAVVAVAVGATGAGLYGSAAADYSSLRQACLTRPCALPDYAAAQARANGGIALLSVAGAALAIDVVLWAVGARQRSRRVTHAWAPAGVRF